MTKKKAYDVFINYRRDGGLDFARSIAYFLRLEGYQCFFDQRELKTGHFNQQIYEAIENSKFFVAVITPGSLDRCANPDDWVRKEIEHAKAMDIPVVPVAVRGKLSFPDSLPASLDWLKSLQASFIDRETDFEETIVKMLRNQLSDLNGMTTMQHRRVQRQAEKVFLKKAARFKNNDGVINDAEREELERLASASGISRTRLEELVETVEASAAKRAKIKAWVKKHVVAVTLSGLAVLGLLAWWIADACHPKPPQGQPASAPAEDMSPAESPAAPQKDPANENMPENANRTTMKKTDKVEPSKTDQAALDIQTAAQKLAQLTPSLRADAESDLRNSLLSGRLKPSDTDKLDAVALQIVKDYEKVAAEGRKLHRLGMYPQELVKSRPDLVLKFAGIRIRVRDDMKQLVKDNKHEEALKYYNSAKRAFDVLGMCPLGRPSFSN